MFPIHKWEEMIKRKQIVQKAGNEVFRVFEVDPKSADTKSLTASVKKAINHVKEVSKENAEEMADAIVKMDNLQKNIEILNAQKKSLMRS